MTLHAIVASLSTLKRIIPAAVLFMSLQSGAQVLFRDSRLTITEDSTGYALRLAPGTMLTDVVITVNGPDGSVLFLENHHSISDFSRTIRKTDLGSPAGHISVRSRELNVTVPPE